MFLAMHNFTESIIDQATIDWLGSLGYAYAFGLDLAFDRPVTESESYEDIILLDRLQEALACWRGALLPKWIIWGVKVQSNLVDGD